jgi:putrescine transport system ATP-binding protein
VSAAQDASVDSDSGAEAYIRLDGVSKTFGDVIAVHDVSLDIGRGEIFCLLGGSGCGKTTLLRVLAGFEQPSAGRVVIDGVDMANVPPYDRPVNMMFQSYALFQHMTVEQNVTFGLEQERLPRGDISARAGEMLALVKLHGFERRKPHQLSGGQRQRVALARALVKRPKLLLLDEPLAALDKKLREYTQFELLNIQKTLGTTFIVVTHDQEEAMTLGSRIGVMNQGRIVQVGTAHDIYEAPNSRFVADFIGSINLFAGQVLEDGPGHARIGCAELNCVVDLDRSVGAAARGPIWIALRPEKIEITATPQLSSDNVAQGIVQDIAYMGNASAYLVRVGTGTVVRVTQPNTRRTDESIAPGQPVFVHWHRSSPVVVSE